MRPVTPPPLMLSLHPVVLAFLYLACVNCKAFKIAQCYSSCIPSVVCSCLALTSGGLVKDVVT